MKRVTRVQLRGKPLDADCKRWGKPDPYQYGLKDKRCFCTGIWNPMYEAVEEKCVSCNAWNSNAEPQKGD